jgi:hypothetical protein
MKYVSEEQKEAQNVFMEKRRLNFVQLTEKANEDYKKTKQITWCGKD